MKLTSFITAFMLTITISATADELVIPEGINYIKTTEETNQLAKAKLLKLFTSEAKKEEVLSLFANKFLICGPALWLEIKDDKSLSEIETGTVALQMPIINDKQELVRMQEESGKLFQSPDEIWIFWNAFVKRTDFTDLKIRKLNPLELEIFWAMIPFDITEPLFILESQQHKILTVFASPDDLKIMWIDDYQNVTFEEKKE